MSELQVSIVTFNSARTIDDCLRSVIHESAGLQADIDGLDAKARELVREHSRR